MARVATVGGITGIGFLTLGLGLPKLIDGLPPTVSYGLSALGAILLLTAFIWSLLNKGGDSSGTTQGTSGPHSPNYAKVEGGVHNYFGPPPAPEPAPPTSPWDDPEFSLLNPAAPPRRDKSLIADMPFEHVLSRLWDQIDKRGKGADQIDREIKNEFIDAIAQYRLAVWGRRVEGQPIERVWDSAIKRGEFSHRKGEITYRDPDNVMAVHRWYDLKFNSDQIDDWLPPSWKTM